MTVAVLTGVMPISKRSIKMITPETNEILLKKIAQRDEPAFFELVKRFKTQLLHVIYRYTGNRQDAEDILQDVFVKIYLHAEKYNDEFKATTWIYTIALNTARTAYKKKNRWLIFSSMMNKNEDEPDFIDSIEDFTFTPGFYSDSDDQEEIINSVLSKINPSFREALILRDMEGLSYEDIGDVLGLNMGTVKSKINRGREEFKRLLKKEIDK